MNAIKPISTGRLTIRTFENRDMAALHRLESDQDVKRYLEGPTKHSLFEYQTEFINRQTGPYNVLAITTGQDGQFVGRCGLGNFQSGGRELSVVLAKEFWKMGYGSEVGSVLIRIAFDDLKTDSVVGVVHPENANSLKLIQKLGLSLQEGMRDILHPNNLVYRLMATRWRGARSRISVAT